MEASQSDNRHLPSVDYLLNQTQHLGIPRPLRKRLIQESLQVWRQKGDQPRGGRLEDALTRQLHDFNRKRLRPVINATGVVLHTNLGRAPLPTDLQSSLQAALGYNNLELNLETGKRGRRGIWLEKALSVMCQCEDIALVNNCAAALILILMALRKDANSEVIISRGELVQIGGGFRIPEIMTSAGVRLREVGTTNHTTIQDYEQALSPKTVMMLKVHQSNFVMSGFVSAPSVQELASLAQHKQVPLVMDLGSGALIDTEAHFDIQREMTPEQVIRQGADLVCFSGDKLLGGPQAGIIAGTEALVREIRQHPMYRALRIDKLALAGMEGVISHHLEALENLDTISIPQLPSYLHLGVSMTTMRSRATHILRKVWDGTPMPATSNLADHRMKVVEDSGRVGGGTMPASELPSLAIELQVDKGDPEAISSFFRERSEPIIGHWVHGAFRLNLRTIHPDEDQQIVQALKDWVTQDQA
jgi:L-seryl-tRNA(Ser) seleniumtransferase